MSINAALVCAMMCNKTIKRHPHFAIPSTWALFKCYMYYRNAEQKRDCIVRNKRLLASLYSNACLDSEHAHYKFTVEQRLHINRLHFERTTESPTFFLLLPRKNGKAAACGARRSNAAATIKKGEETTNGSSAGPGPQRCAATCVCLCMYVCASLMANSTTQNDYNTHFHMRCAKNSARVRQRER